MSRLLLIVIVTVLVAPASPHADAAAQTGAADMKTRAAGRALYVDHCASCHGASGLGDGPAAASLRTTPSDLTRHAQKNGGVFPSEQLRRVIDGRGVGAHGSAEMPVWGSVFKAAGASGEVATRQRIEAIVAYLQSLQQRSGD
jgi:mono/diheme cytochrome c family protein